MANLRSSKRLELGVAATRSRAKAASTHASSSSAKASRNPQSDENTPLGRRTLGDIKNVVDERKSAAEASGSRRKPLSDRNAPIQPVTSLASGKTKNSSVSQHNLAQASRPSSSRRPPTSVQPQSKAASASAKSSSAGLVSRREHRAQLRSPLQEVSHVQVTSLRSSGARADDSFSSQIEAAGRRTRKQIPSHDELTRLSPVLDSDDLEYLDVSNLPQARSAHIAPNSAQRRSRDSGSEDKSSDAEAAASRGSSDKENVPPPALRASTRAGNRHLTRACADVLGEVRGRQPTHSTPISSKRPTASRKASNTTYLDNEFLDDSDHLSHADSPGVARRAQVLTQSAQQLQEYQDRGVTKVMAWKAAGHDEAFKTQQNPSVAGSDDRSAASWRAAEDAETTGYPSGSLSSEHEDPDRRARPGNDDAADSDIEARDDNMDEFGFFIAERKLQTRRVRPRADDEDDFFGPHLAEADDSNVYVDLSTEPPVNTTSDDRRLAEQAFGRMSSPAPHRSSGSSSTAEPSSVVLVGAQHAEQAQQAEASLDTEDRGKVKVEAAVPKGRVTRTSTRTSTKRKSDAASDSIEELPLSTSPIPTRKNVARAKRASMLASGIPLKRSEKKELAMLERLAAETSSPADSSPPSSPGPTSGTKKAGSSSPAKRLRMDDLISELPRSKSRALKGKANASGSSKKKPTTTTTTARKGKAGSRGQGSTAKATASEQQQDDDDDDGEADDDDFEEVVAKKRPRQSTVTAAKAGKARAKGKKKASTKPKPEDSDEENWRDLVTSSQIHSDDSERTKRLKEFQAAEKYNLEVERVL